MIDANLRLPAQLEPAQGLPTILYVDDEANALKYFQRAIAPLANVLTATSVEEGKRILDEQAERIAVLVSDQRMPGAYGNELLSYAWDRHPHIVRILTTAYSELEHTVEGYSTARALALPPSLSARAYWFSTSARPSLTWRTSIRMACSKSSGSKPEITIGSCHPCANGA